MVAAQRPVLRDAGDSKHVVFDDVQRHAELARELLGVLQLEPGLEGRLQKVGGRIAARRLGGVEQVSGIHPAGERDRYPRVRGKKGFERHPKDLLSTKKGSRSVSLLAVFSVA